MLRVVLDPGVLVSALISKQGSPAKLLLSWRGGSFELVASPKLLQELGRVLARPKFRRYASLDEVEQFVRMIQRGATLVEDPPDPPAASLDPGDDYLVALARAGGVDALVSGDPHLTTVAELESLVSTPREFLDRLDRS